MDLQNDVAQVSNLRHTNQAKLNLPLLGPLAADGSRAGSSTCRQGRTGRRAQHVGLRISRLACRALIWLLQLGRRRRVGLRITKRYRLGHAVSPWTALRRRRSRTAKVVGSIDVRGDEE